MDVHKIGTFTNGRFTPLVDLNDGASISFVRGTFKVTPYQEDAIYPKASRRYGGSRQVGEVHGNGQIQATWLLSGGTSDGTLAVFDGLVQWLESSRQDLFYLWRPDGASKSTYYDLRGGVPWEPLYSWVEFSGAKVLQVTGGWQVAPLTVGDRLDIFDDFTVDTIGDYTVDAGSGTLAVSGGQMVPSSTAAKRLRHTGRGYLLQDQAVTIKVTPATTGLQTAMVTLGGLHLGFTAGALMIGKVGGADLVSSSPTTYAPTASTPYWIRGRKEGNVLVVEHWTAAPTPLGTPAHTQTVTLTGGDITAYGAGVALDAGIEWTPANTGDRVDDFRAEPYTYVRGGAQTVAAHVLALPGIPGTAPALVDAHTSMLPGILRRSALIGWAQTSAPALGGAVPFGLLLDSTGSTTDASMSGGKNIGASGNFTQSVSVEPGTLSDDDFADTVSIELWAILVAGATGTMQVKSYAYGETATSETNTIYSAEYGNQARAVNVSAGRVLTRLGTFTVPTEGLWRIVLSATGSASVSKGLDALIAVPARQRASTATGQAEDDAQLWTYSNLAQAATKIVRSDLSATIAAIGEAPAPSPGLSGQLLEFPPGDVSVLHRLGKNVVDAPDAVALEDLATSTMAVHYAITPRYHLARSG